jgi:hypothetical protein
MGVLSAGKTRGPPGVPPVFFHHHPHYTICVRPRALWASRDAWPVSPHKRFGERFRIVLGGRAPGLIRGAKSGNGVWGDDESRGRFHAGARAGLPRLIRAELCPMAKCGAVFRGEAQGGAKKLCVARRPAPATQPPTKPPRISPPYGPLARHGSVPFQGPQNCSLGVLAEKSPDTRI